MCACSLLRRVMACSRNPDDECYDRDTTLRAKCFFLIMGGEGSPSKTPKSSVFFFSQQNFRFITQNRPNFVVGVFFQTEFPFYNPKSSEFCFFFQHNFRFIPTKAMGYCMPRSAVLVFSKLVFGLRKTCLKPLKATRVRKRAVRLYRSTRRVPAVAILSLLGPRHELQRPKHFTRRRTDHLSILT